MPHLRGKVMFVSLGLCILAISGAFILYYGQIYQPSPLLNTNFKFWTYDPAKNVTRPYLWEVDLIQGPLDNATVYEFNVEGRPSVALRVFRTNENNTSVWTTVHLRQDLRGQGLEAIFRSKISLWVYPTFPYWYNPESKNPENVFGVEINDGTNLLWYVFSDQPSQVFQLPRHRIVLVQTPLNQWSLREVDIAQQYREAGWPKPQSISFILIAGTTWLRPGSWVGYASGMKVDVGPLETQALNTVQKLYVVTVDAALVAGLVAMAAFLPKPKQEARRSVGPEARRSKSRT